MDTVKTMLKKVWDYTKFYTVETVRDYKSAFSVYPNVIIWTVVLTALVFWIV